MNRETAQAGRHSPRRSPLLPPPPPRPFRQEMAPAAAGSDLPGGIRREGRLTLSSGSPNPGALASWHLLSCLTKVRSDTRPGWSSLKGPERLSQVGAEGLIPVGTTGGPWLQPRMDRVSCADRCMIRAAASRQCLALGCTLLQPFMAVNLARRSIIS